jgi:Xaa-Pro aminopeptidase
MVEHGARPLLGSIGFGERGALVDFAPSERLLAEGEAIRLDVGCVLDGYHADLARTAVLGESPLWLTEAHAALLAGEQSALAALRAGVSGADVFASAVLAVRGSGLEDYERSHCGHGIGLNMYEPPSIRPDSHDPIVAGMTCCVETPLYMIGKAGVQIEDAVLVTEAGCERLGALPQELLAAGLPIQLPAER